MRPSCRAAAERGSAPCAGLVFGERLDQGGGRPIAVLRRTTGSRGAVSTPHSPSSVATMGTHPFPTAVGTVERVLGVAAPAIATMFESALPGPQIFRALADEVRKAVATPRS